ncbi:hypothetical protein ACSW9O_15375 (plasmid) [Clostridium perfringens]|nr:hypothetical protein [Clostridium perfringens]
MKNDIKLLIVKMEDLGIKVKENTVKNAKENKSLTSYFLELQHEDIISDERYNLINEFIIKTKGNCILKGTYLERKTKTLEKSEDYRLGILLEDHKKIMHREELKRQMKSLKRD